VIDINVKGDLRNIERHLNKLQRRAVPKAAARAINRVIKTVQSEAARAIAKDTAFKVKEARQFLGMKKATWTQIEGKVIAERHSPNLIRFAAVQTKGGVKAKPYQKRRLYKHTFIANKGRTVFVRKGRSRLPIRPIYGPSIRAEFTRDQIRRIYATKAAQRWPIEMRAALQFYLSKL